MSLDTESRAKADPWSGIFVGPILKRLLGCLKVGKIIVCMPNGATLDHQTGRPGPEATVVLYRWRALRRLLAGGDIAFAEAYMDGDWSSPDLTALLELAAVNIAEIEHAITGLLPVRLFNRARHLLRANSRRGSRRNIAFHYDLGNEFYRLWLDPSMTYSSALYRAHTETLEEAQENKLDRVAELLAAHAGAEILEIGCGWGALAARLAKAGASVKGITLSTEQLACARDVAEKSGVRDKVKLELQDYRDCGGAFDGIVSIEMLEAVGEHYWPVYFDKLRRLLKPDGKAVLQVISIDDSRFESYRRNPDFIQHYIFPGGMLPTKALIVAHAQAAGLKLASSEFFGESYARTLAEWRSRFRQNSAAVLALGFDHRFRRMWEYYLAYCEVGFKNEMIDVGLFVFEVDQSWPVPGSG